MTYSTYSSTEKFLHNISNLELKLKYFIQTKILVAKIIHKMKHKKLQILAISLHFLQCKYPWKSSYTYFPLTKLYLIIHSMTREMLDLSNVTHHQCNSCSYTHIYLLQIVWLGDNFMIQTLISVSAKF